MSELPKKKLGRPRIYENEPGKKGAPMLGFRFDPELYEYIQTKPEGPRKFLEGLVRKELERAESE